jgi:hypothetical protein
MLKYMDHYVEKDKGARIILNQYLTSSLCKRHKHQSSICTHQRKKSNLLHVLICSYSSPKKMECLSPQINQSQDFL